jgi:hypothetical protein
MRRPLALLSASLSALLLAACASTVSTGAFKGEEHAIAQTISNLQGNATAGEEKKICAEDLAGSVVGRLGGIKGCEKAVKNQINEADNLEVSVESVSVAAGASTATARVKSIYSGKHAISAVSLVKEADGKWKISAFS